MQKIWDRWIVIIMPAKAHGGSDLSCRKLEEADVNPTKSLSLAVSKYSIRVVVTSPTFLLGGKVDAV